MNQRDLIFATEKTWKERGYKLVGGAVGRSVPDGRVVYDRLSVVPIKGEVAQLRRDFFGEYEANFK